MPIDIYDKRLCNGCAACANICPTACLSMQPDECGFLYPYIEKSRCIGCELCKKVCPMDSDHMQEGRSSHSPLSIYAAWSKDREVRYHSTSGGMFSELGNYVLKTGGCVVGAAYGNENIIEHQIITDVSGIEKLRQSKYAQSNINEIYSKIKILLKKQNVLFCGTPCQVAGLKSFLGKENSNLYTVDFICRGVNSPKAYRYWLKELEENEHAKVVRVWFKYKEDGWKASPRCTRLDFDNEKILILKGKDNLFMSGYLGPNLYIRPSCGECMFKGENRYSDITIGDFWGIDESLDDDQGTSVFQVNTSKGQELLTGIQDNIYAYECSAEQVRQGNICMEKSVTINLKSKKFLQNLGGTIPFSKLLKKYTRKGVGDKIRGGIRKLWSYREKRGGKL